MRPRRPRCDRRRRACDAFILYLSCSFPSLSHSLTTRSYAQSLRRAHELFSPEGIAAHAAAPPSTTVARGAPVSR